MRVHEKTNESFRYKNEKVKDDKKSCENFEGGKIQFPFRLESFGKFLVISLSRDDKCKSFLKTEG